MLNKIKNLVLATSALFMLGAAIPVLAHADTAGDIKSGVNTAAGGADTSKAGDNLGNTVQTVVNILSIVVGVIAVFVIIIAGLRFITSSGNEQGIAQAKSTIIYAVVGIIIVAFAQIIVRFAVNASSCDPAKDQSCPGYCDQNPNIDFCKEQPASGSSSGNSGGAAKPAPTGTGGSTVICPAGKPNCFQ